MMEGWFSGRGWLFALVILALDAWAIYKTIGSDASGGQKVFWSVLILVLPLLGLVIWSLAGPRIARPGVYDHEPP